MLKGIIPLLARSGEAKRPVLEAARDATSR
jgi:hypothetical protein